jgi:hypothetical protein
MGWALTLLGGGYARIDGVMYTAYVVVTDEVTEAERDEYLRLFSHRPASPGEATRWLRQWMKETKMKQPDIEELPGFEELFAKSIAKAIQKMPLEERLEGLAPEQVLGAFAPSSGSRGSRSSSGSRGSLPNRWSLHYRWSCCEPSLRSTSARSRLRSRSRFAGASKKLPTEGSVP